MANGSRYGIQRGLFISFCVLVIAVGFLRSCSSFVQSFRTPRPQVATVVLPPGFQRRFCDEQKTIDYTNKNPERIKIVLHEGCYGDHYILPKAWRTYEPQKTANVGDYASIWCDNEPNPRSIVPYTASLHSTMNDCPAGRNPEEFTTQGRGTITLVRTQIDPEALATVQNEQHEELYKLTLTVPTSGANDDYKVAIYQCHRSDEKILCSGNVTNKTDARTNLILHGGSSVDDEGNSAGLNMMFPGANNPYGTSMYLIPDVPTNFTITIDDNHQKAKSVSLAIHTDWEKPHDSHYDDLIYKDIPVQ